MFELRCEGRRIGMACLRLLCDDVGRGLAPRRRPAAHPGQAPALCGARAQGRTNGRARWPTNRGRHFSLTNSSLWQPVSGRRQIGYQYRFLPLSCARLIAGLNSGSTHGASQSSASS